MHTDDPAEIEEDRKTLEHLKRALDENRPGERSIFGTGYNPMPGETK